MKTIPGRLLIVILLVSGYCSSEAQDFGRRERRVDVQHYDIDVRFIESERTVIGDVTVRFRSLRDGLSRVDLDAVNMRIKSVRDGKGKGQRYTYDSLILGLLFDPPLSYGQEASVRIGYDCVPRKGLYFIQPNASYPDDPRQIWTQGQGEDNRHWLPCYDYPNDKATSEIRMTVDEDFETLSNGVLRSREEHDNGTTTWHWVQDKPHSSYLIMLAAGEYEIYEDDWQGITVNSYYYEDDDSDDVQRAYGSTAEMLEFFSNVTGMKYPWAKYAQIPVRHFLYGGMENTSATVMADTRMVVDARAALNYSAEPLIAHELAHQWFGDYVTYIDWDNEWLNEGFATYYQQLWTLHRRGRDVFDYQRYKGIRSYMRYSDQNGRMPVVRRGHNNRALTYSKGAAVLHMLKNILGVEQYRRVIHAFLERHALGNVETNDLKRCIEDVTGMNLHWFFEQWLYEAGYPEVEVSNVWDESARQLTLTFRQVQKVDSLCGYFRLPVPLHVQMSQGEYRDTVWIDGAEHVAVFDLSSRPRQITVDYGSTICGVVTLRQGDEQWIAQLRGNRDVIKRLQAADELFGRLANPAVREALLEAARRDPFHGVRKHVATKLAELKPGDPEFEDAQWRTSLKKSFLDMLGDPRADVRSTALNGLNNFRDPGLLDVFFEALEDSSYYVEAAAMNCVLTIDTVGSWPVVRERLLKSSRDDVLARAAMDWVIEKRYTQALPILMQLASPGHSFALRSKAMQAMPAAGVSQEQYSSLIRKQLAEPRYEFRLLAVQALRAIDPVEARRIIRRHMPTEKDERVVKAIQEMHRY